MKKFKRIITVAVLILIVLAAVKISPLALEFMSISKYQGEDVSFEVAMGAGASQVADDLVERGIIKNRYTFIARVRFFSKGSIYYGTHTIENGMTLGDIVNVLTTPPEDTNTVTLSVPEGYSIEMIALRAADAGLCTYDEFINALGDDYDYEFINHIPAADYKYKLEGFLFPNTYEFFATDDAHAVIDKMLGAFQNEYAKYFTGYDRIYEIVTKASIVEREAVLDSERATIAGVINNRLAKDMLLQVDATVVYAKSAGLYDMTQVTYADLEVMSPYNTYKTNGLTPGPICNPGIKSILAAAKPESHEWLFYHTDEVKKDGSHIFTKTFDDHVATMN